MVERWVGIDCGYSQMTIAILDDRVNIIALERTCEPIGDGHDRGVAIARLKVLVNRLKDFSCVPVKLSGYCYDNSGIIETFREAGWTVNGCKALNDAVGFYGITNMSGNTIIGECGSFSQVIYVGSDNNIYWPGDDVAAELPNWMLSGWSYASFLLELSKRENTCELTWLRQAVRDILGGGTIKISDNRWSYLGPMLERLNGTTELEQFLARAAESVLKSKDIFMRHMRVCEPPKIILGGGAVQNDELWSELKTEFEKRGEDVIRIEGEPAVGLARFAAYKPNANPWAYIGSKRPSWL
jgi:hypothetical protein